MSPAPPAPAVPASPAALAAHLATALAEVDRLKSDLDATARRAAAAENVLRALAPDDAHPPHDAPLSPAALAGLVQAETRANAAEQRLQSVLDAWAELLRAEERAADERKRIDDETRAARRTLYPAAPLAAVAAARHAFPGGSGTVPRPVLPRVNGAASNTNPRIRPRTASDAPPHAPAKRARNNNWATQRTNSRSPELLAGPAHPAPGAPDADAAGAPPPHPTHGGEPSVEDLLLETVERPPRALRAEPTLLNVPTPAKAASLSKPGGPRSCRQCGQAGRYKDGKCVEKWGPGPEGPGTVCDRCRKKMKRVERRGDPLPPAAHAAAQPTPAAALAPPSSPPPTFSPLPPSASSASPPSEDIASSKEDSASGDGDGSAEEVAHSVKREMSVGA